MMNSTAALQVNLQAGPRGEWPARVARAYRLGPTLVAIAANSPWLHGRDTGWKSVRQRAWGGLNARTCGPVPGCAPRPGRDESLDPASAWARFAMRAPVTFVRAGDDVLAVGCSVPFSQWASGAVKQQGENLWSLAFGAPSSGAPGSDSDIARDQRFALFDAVRGYLDQAARPSGLVVVLDDVQWAGEPSMLLLAHLVRQLAAMSVAVIATWRVPGESASSVLQALAADSATERLDLGGLSIGALEELLAASGYPSLVRQAEGLLADTGGNPFYIRELVRAQAEQPAARGQLTVPASVRDVTGQRLARLDPASQLALSAAAVAGGEFSVGVVALMLGVPALTLLGTVDRCIAAGFLTPAERPGEFRFAHALVRAAVADQLTSAERRRWHDVAADAIAAFHQDRVGPHLAELASHLVHSSMPGDRIRAVLACEAAADVAAEDLAFEEAARLYREALATGHDELPEQDRSRLELALAVAAYRIGDLTSWHGAVMAVGHRAELRKGRDLLARAALAMEPTGGARWDGEISRLCEQALVGEQLTGELRVRVEARYAHALAYRGDEERASEVSLRALQAAERTAGPTVLIGALQARLQRPGRPQRASRTCHAHAGRRRRGQVRLARTVGQDVAD